MLQTFDPRNRDLIVNINGELVAPRPGGRQPVRLRRCRAATPCGKGCGCTSGRIFRLEQHLDRLIHSAMALAFTQIPTHEAITNEIRRTLAANRMFDGVHIRLTLTRGVKITSGMDPRLNTSGPTLIVLAEHKAPVYSKAGLSLVTAACAAFRPTASTRRSTTTT